MTDNAPERLPCGSWPTPITAGLVVQQASSIGAVAVDGADVYWSELRPHEGGRTQIVRKSPGAEPVDVLPAGANARTAVHEYGGGAWWVANGVVWYVDWSDQRLRKVEPGAEPVLVTPEAPEGGSVRWADGDVHPVDGRVAVVRETHPVGGRGAVDVVNEIVVLDHAGEQDTVVSGPDFVSDPRWSPDGAALAWLEWDHPSMPWDSSALKVQNGLGVVTVAGGVDDAVEGICQPQWAPDGSLWFCSDRADWWWLYRWTPAGGVEEMFTEPGDVGAPKWTFGHQRYAFLADGRVVLAVLHEGVDSVRLLGENGSSTALPVGATSVADVAASGAEVVLIGSSPVEEEAVLHLAVDAPEQVEVLSPRRELGIDPEWYAGPEHIEFPGGDGRPTYANFYRPTNPTAQPLEGELPPLIVMIHGGPTSNATSTLSLARQFWTSRGFAVADVDYGGSTGYGRAYRDRLQGHWGILDVGDCVAVVRWLGEQGWVDPARAVIRGGSAGGFTVLMALAVSDVFAAGADYFGVADVEALALETHKFESRYLDGLIAPYPEGRDVYTARSPLTHLDSLTSPLVVLQGSEDKVVPPAQSEMIVAALREKGLPVAYRLYEGEQHGFRQAENIQDSLEAELSFYSQVLGFDLPAGESIPPLEIENLRR
ncbi:MAG: peptidase (acylaminoacyl-peptidase) family [Marmoricola sp.]|jgi:dipeptidyl aminopeptidase/acylaminoacyl peptidase|nr:peptidase (acylaminoacyl-peptidase) family [Marmoricola sp.]